MNQSKTRMLLLTSLMTALTCMGGWIRVPMIPVPFTLQTLFVYLSGIILGARLGAISQILFLIIGLIGFPVFSQGGGFGYVLHPTFGYLAAFPLAAFFVGWLTNRKSENKESKIFYIATGLAAFGVLLIGAVTLFLNLKYVVHKPIPFHHALWMGAAVFIPGECLKIILAGWIGKRLSKIAQV